ncbi:hypothetical protein QLL95_gp0191 [Cotonvirus japonicus]|uniref:Uncharacterized protein n=1 Tax=Cotonvirus japonicus TaxID=2811091 RepID=A0ABM7NRA0_9VIRU|nr:hypothetical protein QLL95_gp0191 [Cotonvirus japonicus]BCS82680.1 hypothetical protein [Cotonvirus japonicus]
MSMKTKINGPINLVRMEGIVNDVNKIIYLFMDRHDEVNDQTNCADPKNSIDISDYLKKSFNHLDPNKTYDFFMEIFPENLDVDTSQILYSKPDFELKYLYRVSKFFRENILIDNKENILSSRFDNIRLHYIDIRDKLHIVLTYIVQFIKDNINQTIDHIKKGSNNTDDYLSVLPIIIKTSIKVITKSLSVINNSFKNLNHSENYHKPFDHIYIENFEDFILDSNQQDTLYNNIEYLIGKITHDYNHNNIKKFINSLVPVYITKYIDKLLNILENFIKTTNDFTGKDYVNNCDKILDQLIHIRGNIFIIVSHIMDLYFLRRFLDKDYITNVIIYTGAAHSLLYIYVLVQLGMKITNVARTNVNNLTELNQNIKSIKNFPSEKSYKQLMYIFDIDDYTPQCVDISYFPDNFE